MMEDLKPCPFCGGEGKKKVLNGLWYYGCARDGLGCDCVDMGPYAENEHHHWNTRADDWQPIETAPKDGTKILILIDEGKNILQGYWNIAGERWKATNQSGFPYPIMYPYRWMHLPERPKQ